MKLPGRRWGSLALPGSVTVTIMLWASAFPGIRVGLDGYGAGELALLRYLIASVALGTYAVRRQRLRPPRHWRSIVVIGFAGFFVYNLALNLGERTVSAGSASFVISTAPLITALLAAVLLGEPLQPRIVVGSSVALAGIALIALGEGGGLRPEPGVLLVLVAAFAHAAYFVLQRRWLTLYRPLELTTYAMWAGTALMLPFFPSLVGQAVVAPPEATLAAVYLGMMPAAVGYLTWAYVLSRLPASEAAPYLYLVPVIAALIAWFWLDETMGPAAITGGVMTMSGVVLAHRKRKEAKPDDDDVREEFGQPSG